MDKKIFALMLALQGIGSCVSVAPDGHRSCRYESKDLVRSFGNRIFGTKAVNGNITEYRDKGWDSVTAGYYTFFPNGALHTYEFFMNMKEYGYAEEYDSAGNLLRALDCPLLEKYVKRKRKTPCGLIFIFFRAAKIPGHTVFAQKFFRQVSHFLG